MDIVSHRREEKRDKLISTCDGLERRGRCAVCFNWHVLAEYKVHAAMRGKIINYELIISFFFVQCFHNNLMPWILDFTRLISVPDGCRILAKINAALQTSNHSQLFGEILLPTLSRGACNKQGIHCYSDP